MNKLNKETVFILFLITILVRLIFVNSCLYHHDSVQLAEAVEATVSSGQVQPTVGDRYLVVALYSLPYLIYNDAYFSATFMTIMFAGGCVVILFLFAFEYFKSYKIASVCGLLLCFSPLFLAITTYAKSHSVAIFLFLLSLWLLMKEINKKKISILPGLCFSFVVFARFDTVVYISILVILYVMLMEKKSLLDILKITCPLLIAMVIGFTTGLLVRFPTNNTINFLSILPFITKGLVLTMFSMGVAVFFIFGKRLWQRKNIFFIVWFLPILSYYVLNIADVRYYMISIIPLYILAAQNLVRKKPWVICVVILLMFIQIIPVLDYRHNNCGAEDLGLMVTENTMENAVIDSGDYAPFVEYYGKRKTGIKNATHILSVKGKKGKPIKTIEFEDYHHGSLLIKITNITLYEKVRVR